VQSLGYEVAAAGHNQWNGVALISRVGLDEVQVGFEEMPGWGDPVAPEARAIGAVCGGVRIWSLYVPNGRKPDDPHYAYKLDWLARLRDAAKPWLDDDTALVGDWNVAPLDEDVFDMAQFAKSTHVTPPERAAFQAFLDDGYADVVRPHAPGPEVYTYWDYYRQRFERNRGLRIDFALAGEAGDRRVHRPRGARGHRRLGPRPRGGRPRMSTTGTDDMSTTTAPGGPQASSPERGRAPRWRGLDPLVPLTGLVALVVYALQGFDGKMIRDIGVYS